LLWEKALIPGRDVSRLGYQMKNEVDVDAKSVLEPFLISRYLMLTAYANAAGKS
jgi:hypothetical protein